MKKFCVILVLMLTVCAFAQAEEISFEELKSVLDDAYFLNLLDVRPYEAFEQGAIEGAGSLPLEELEAYLQFLLDQGFSSMSLPIYLYGETEAESREAASIVSSLGFTQVRYLPGIAAWEGQLVPPAMILGKLDTQDIYGNATDFSLIEGKKLTIVNVWGTYCGPCLGEMADPGRLSADMADENVGILGLVIDCSNADMSADEAQTEKARAIVEEAGAAYPHLLPNRTIYRSLVSQISAVPTTFFLDERGFLTGQVYQGARDYDSWKAIIGETLTGLSE